MDYRRIALIILHICVAVANSDIGPEPAEHLETFDFG